MGSSPGFAWLARREPGYIFFCPPLWLPANSGQNSGFHGEARTWDRIDGNPFGRSFSPDRRPALSCVGRLRANANGDQVIRIRHGIRHGTGHTDGIGRRLDTCVSAEMDFARFQAFIKEVRSCRLCVDELPLGPRPVLQASPRARLLIASQAPGTKVHHSGVPFDDESGRRLREWMGITEKEFYDENLVAIVPMGFCYPGRKGGGDAPPRRECAQHWRVPLLSMLPDLRLTLLVGSYAQEAALGPGRVMERVSLFRSHLPEFFPLPHPSWRSRVWAARNPWFETEVLPELKQRVRTALSPLWGDD